MRGLHIALKKMKYDSRMLDWNIKNGKLTDDELKTHLNSLEDLSSECENITLDDEGHDGMADRSEMNGNGEHLGY